MITKTKQWGNSLAVIIPKEEVKRLKLHANEKVHMRIEKSGNMLKEFFGSMKFTRPTEDILRDARKITSKWG
ncbi:MAG: hypothetical protein QF915_03445 [Candidatus Woesearchaeota archaeon]|jgi:antitoxin component of MazEF toxin-antitoxin module|nr:hypothetical protein [Candidatus Woesearchaeota archaeon]